MTAFRESLRQAGVALAHLVRGNGRLGACPICEGRTIFLRTGSWLRDELYCMRCWSIPRWRAVIQALHDRFPDWRELRIHESSPYGSASEKLKRECRQYVGSHLFMDVPRGGHKWGLRCEDLERQTFEDESFDLVVTQDVFEHVLDPASGFREVARTLRPGGAHVFTVPYYARRPTVVRAIRERGELRHLLKPQFHGNPLGSNGSLVVTEWGDELREFIYRCSELTTAVIEPRDSSRGIDGEFLEVFVSSKPARDRGARGS